MTRARLALLLSILVSSLAGIGCSTDDGADPDMMAGSGDGNGDGDSGGDNAGDGGDGAGDGGEGAGDGTADKTLLCETLAPQVSECIGMTFSVADCKEAYSLAVERGCQAQHLAAFEAFVENDGTFQCVSVGFEDDLYPDTSDEAVVIGMLCPLSVANTVCAGISCNTGSDCPEYPSNGSCNDATGACFSDSGYCPALPCNTGSDCPGYPTAMTCNDAIKTCIFTE